GQFSGGDHPRAEAAGAIEILAHVPLARLALEFAYRAFVAAGITGDAGVCVLLREVLGTLADDEDELGLVIERLGSLGTHDRLPVWHQRGFAAHENRGKFRDVVALRTFLDVLEIVEAEADNLARRRNRQPVFEIFERTPRASGRTFGRVLERCEVAVAAAQILAEVTGNCLVDGLEIDHLVALDDAEVQAAIGLETNDFHALLLNWIARF